MGPTARHVAGASSSAAAAASSASSGHSPPVPTSRRRIYSHSYLSSSYAAVNPFDRFSSSNMTMKICIIALASAIPAFFLGTTVSLFLSLDRHCGCDDPHSGSTKAGAGAVGASRAVHRLPESLSFSRRNEAVPINMNQRPAVLPMWVEDVVQERLSQQQQQEALTDKKPAMEKYDEEEERPDKLPLWVDEYVQVRIDEERQQWADQMIVPQTNNNLRSASSFQGGNLWIDPSRLGNYVTGIATTPKVNFTNLLDLGVPLDTLRPGSTDVLMIYSNKNVLPQAVTSTTASGIVQVSAEDAIAKCDYVSVILTDHGDSKVRNQCLAIVPQYESYHIQRWGRLNVQRNIVEPGHPLQLIPYSTKKKGRTEFRPPKMEHYKKTWDLLRLYMNNLDDVLAELDAILQRIAVDNTVIVMVCNFGQSELLINFVCETHARGFDISNVIVFTTDKETDDLARGLGLTTYYDHRNFDHVPKEAAGQYGDARFTAMMLAKVISVQLVSLLGYDLLFSDVDIVWYKNPLDYFQRPDSPVKNHDVIFQDDGSRTLRYAPYSANSGFYFVRQNDRTRHFLSSLLMRSSEILSANSHQKAMVELMTEHVTVYGLRAKVVSKTAEEFPGGFHYNQKSGQFMRDLFAGNVDPYIFHMSWTASKDNKLKYLRQMGEWYVQDDCIQHEASQISGFEDNGIQACCSAEPLISCHYRDKPSKIPCKDSPNIDKGRPSFWK